MELVSSFVMIRMGGYFKYLLEGLGKRLRVSFHHDDNDETTAIVRSTHNHEKNHDLYELRLKQCYREPQEEIAQENKDSEFVETDSCVMLIPGVEGHGHVFESMCESLNMLAATLQMCPHTDMEHTSVTDIAIHMRKSMTKYNIRAKSKFYLVGFSFGVIVALELAAILEQEGLQGVVYCLDSSPDVTKRRLNEYIAKQPDASLQHIVLRDIYRFIATTTDHHLYERLQDCRSWDEKVTLYVSQLKGFGYSMQYIKGIMNSALNRINLALNYDKEMKLKSKIILITKSLSNDEYNLCRWSEQPVTHVHIPAHPHACILLNCRVPYIVHRYST